MRRVAWIAAVLLSAPALAVDQETAEAALELTSQNGKIWGS